MTAPTEQRTEWWATCDDCLTSVIVRPHPERKDDLPDSDDWDDPFASCYVCGGRLDWNSDPLGANDTTHPATVARLKRQRDAALADLAARDGELADSVERERARLLGILSGPFDGTEGLDSITLGWAIAQVEAKP